MSEASNAKLWIWASAAFTVEVDRFRVYGLGFRVFCCCC